MFTKILIPAALAVAVLGVSGAAFAETVYNGGPKGTISIRTTTPSVQTNKPYAQNLPQTQAGVTNHIYSGGPKSATPHTSR